MKYAHDPEGTRLPVKIDSTRNGAFATYGPKTRREFLHLPSWGA